MANEPITGAVYGEVGARDRTRALLLAEAQKPLPELLSAVEDAHSQFVACLLGVSASQAAFEPRGEGEEAFSIAQVARHVAGSALIMGERLLSIGRGETPRRGTSPGYFGDVETESLPEIAPYLHDAIAAIRSAVIQLNGFEKLDSLTPHPMFGELNCRGYLRLIGLHFLDHVNQVGKIKADSTYPLQ
jgi:hypothetical protein